MSIALDTDVYYLSEINGKSKAAACCYIMRKGKKEFSNDVAVDVLSTITKHVISSAPYAKIGTFYYGCKRTMLYQTTLEYMGHPLSDPTTVTTNNITAHGITIGTMSSKPSTPNDMRFQWLKCNILTQSRPPLWI